MEEKSRVFGGENGGVVSFRRVIRCGLAVLLGLGGRKTRFDLESRAVVPRRPRKIDPRVEGMPLCLTLQFAGRWGGEEAFTQVENTVLYQIYISPNRKVH